MNRAELSQIYHSSLMMLVDQAHTIHKKNFPGNKVQASQLLSIKTGGCPENCSYCSQSARHKTKIKRERLVSLDQVMEKARQAKQNGATRFCMGAAWREIRDGLDFDRVLDMVKSVSDLGLEVCCTLGMLNLDQAKRLKNAGLYAYNHNIDTSRNFYPNIITTRSFNDRLQTLKFVREAGITVCTGGILGMGESHDDRIDFILELASLQPQPESVTINKLVPIPGTPLEKQKPIPAFDVIRVIASSRIVMPKSFIRLSAGRNTFNESEQFLGFYSGANSIFLGDELLTTPNCNIKSDHGMLKSMGMSLMS